MKEYKFMGGIMSSANGRDFVGSLEGMESMSVVMDGCTGLAIWVLLSSCLLCLGATIPVPQKYFSPASSSLRGCASSRRTDNLASLLKLALGRVSHRASALEEKLSLLFGCSRIAWPVNALPCTQMVAWREQKGMAAFQWGKERVKAL